MVEMKLYKYEPDYVVAPGEVLEETLETRNIKKVDLAKRCGLSAKTVSQIIGGIAPISPETALCFQRVLGVSANIWNNLEANYRLFLARQNIRKELLKSADWAKKFPVKQLIDRGLIECKEDPVDILEQLIEFFGVGSIEAWKSKFEQMQVSFRCSPTFQNSSESVSTWLRIGELCAAKMKCNLYDKNKFISALSEIRNLTLEEPEIFEPKMKTICADAGVAFVLVGELPGIHVSGVTRWIAKDKAIIMLSLRYKTEDHFWFSFFHEAGHILLGPKKSIFLDEVNNKWKSQEEERANEFASDILIPEDGYKNFVENGIFTHSSVQKLAQELEIAPGIIVGRLQHDKIIPWQALNNLKRKFELTEACG